MNSHPASDAMASSARLWDFISPTRLNTWLACPLKFKFRYVEGLRVPATPARLLGQAVHAALEDFYRHRQLGIQLASEQVIRRAMDRWNELARANGVQFTDQLTSESCQAQLAKLLPAYFAQLDRDEPPPLAVEVTAQAPLIDPQTGEDLGIPLLGILDLVLPGPAGPMVVDFKTTARSAEPLAVIHEVQLTCYSYLLRQCAGERESGMEIRNLIKTKRPQVQVERHPTREEAHFQRLFALIRVECPRFLVQGL